jgi:hypothetical protein
MVQDVGGGQPVHLGKLGITPEQAANLRQLADYLLTLPAEYPDFEMDSYVQDDNDHDGKAYVAECGTAACAAGHGPIAGITPLPEEEWDDYCYRAFVNDLGAWSWCFSGLWSGVDNTAHGAALRIIWMLERGLPDDADAQKWGNSPLCYREQASA